MLEVAPGMVQCDHRQAFSPVARAWLKGDSALIGTPGGVA